MIATLVWPLIVVTLGTLTIVLALAAGAFLASYNWANQFQVAVVSWIVITVTEICLCYFAKTPWLIIPAELLWFILTIYNGIFASILLVTWFYLESKGWRLVREDESPSE